MKKLILWLTAAALLLSLCACDNGNESTDSSPKEKEQQTDFSHERCGVDAAPFFSVYAHDLQNTVAIRHGM